MKNLLVIVSVLLISLTSCEYKSHHIKPVVNAKTSYSAKKEYLNVLDSINSVENGVDYNTGIIKFHFKDDFDSAMKQALAKNDSVLYKILLGQKLKEALEAEAIAQQLSKFKLIQDSLLRNDTVLINRSIRNTDTYYYVELKFQYFDLKHKIKTK